MLNNTKTKTKQFIEGAIYIAISLILWEVIFRDYALADSLGNFVARLLFIIVVGQSLQSLFKGLQAGK